MPLQRVLTDFGADESFEKAVLKTKEHYGVDVSKTTTRSIVEKHAFNIEANQKVLQRKLGKQKSNDVIAEIDGSMVPVILGHKEEQGDRRKTKFVGWREAKLSLAYKKGTIHPVYNITMGSVDEAGQQLLNCVKAAGSHNKTRIHCVGDGAPWIVDQVDQVFGTQATYLIDFYHMSEYLSEAAQCCAPSDKENWRKMMQNHMKKNEINSVLKVLENHINENECDEPLCAAKKCYQYITKRLNQLDYKGAIEEDLPIGSGSIESAHKSIVQKRIKIPGAWWDEANVGAMASMRVARANGLWDDYWALQVKHEFLDSRVN